MKFSFRRFWILIHPKKYRNENIRSMTKEIKFRAGFGTVCVCVQIQRYIFSILFICDRNRIHFFAVPLKSTKYFHRSLNNICCVPTRKPNANGFFISLLPCIQFKLFLASVFYFVEISHEKKVKIQFWCWTFGVEKMTRLWPEYSV